MKTFVFTVGMIGHGDTPEQAWADAIEGFCLDPGPLPEYEEDDEEE